MNRNIIGSGSKGIVNLFIHLNKSFQVLQRAQWVLPLSNRMLLGMRRQNTCCLNIFPQQVNACFKCVRQTPGHFWPCNAALSTGHEIKTGENPPRKAWKSVKHHLTDQKHQISARRFLRKTFPRVKCHRVLSVCVVQERQRVSMTHKYTHGHTRTNAGGLCGGDFNRHVQIAAAIGLICATSTHQSSCSALGNTHRHAQTQRTHMQRTDPSGPATFDPQGVTCGDACKPDPERWRQSTAAAASTVITAVLCKWPLVSVAAGRYWSCAHRRGNNSRG